jgi:hypothetical protein
MPHPETLARFFALELVEPRALRLSAGDNSGTLIRFDADGRPIEIRSAEKPVLRFEHGGDRLTLIRSDGTRIRGRRVTTSEPVTGFDPGELAVLDVPLMAPDQARSRAAARAVGSNAWQRAMRQRLASEIASGNRAGARQTLAELAARGALGAPTLLAQELFPGSEPWKALESGSGGDPVLEYLRAWRVRETSRRDDGSRGRAAELADGAPGRLSRLAELEAVSYSDARSARAGARRATNTAARHPRSPRPLAAERFARLSSEDTSALWAGVANVPSFEVIALLEASRCECRADYAAAERFERGFAARARGAFSALDADVRLTFS